jgi:hypothetical protein
MRSLWFKLMGAFVLVILIGVVTDAFLVSRITSAQFNRYVTRNGQLWAQRLAPTLADYYARTGSWQGVEDALRNPWMAAAGNPQSAQGRPRWMGMNGMMGEGMMGQGMGDSMGMMGDDMLAWMGLRLLLANESGRVVVDTASSALGTTLAAADRWEPC